MGKFIKQKKYKNKRKKMNIKRKKGIKIHDTPLFLLLKIILRFVTNIAIVQKGNQQ